MVTVAVRASAAASRTLRMIRRFTSGSQEPVSSPAWPPSIKPGQPASSRAEMTSSAPSALAALPVIAARNSSRVRVLACGESSVPVNLGLSVCPARLPSEWVPDVAVGVVEAGAARPLLLTGRRHAPPEGRPGSADHGQRTSRRELCLLPRRHGSCHLADTAVLLRLGAGQWSSEGSGVYAVIAGHLRAERGTSEVRPAGA